MHAYIHTYIKELSEPFRELVANFRQCSESGGPQSTMSALCGGVYMYAYVFVCMYVCSMFEPCSESGGPQSTMSALC